MGQLSVDLSAHVASLRRNLRKEERTGMSFPRHFTADLEPGKTPYDDRAVGTENRVYRQ